MRPSPLLRQNAPRPPLYSVGKLLEWVQSDRARRIDILYGVQPTLPNFVPRNKLLGFAQSSSQDSLTDTGRDAPSNEALN